MTRVFEIGGKAAAVAAAVSSWFLRFAAAALIRDGQMLEVDGDAGVLRIL
jgi:hypothetical protein